MKLYISDICSLCYPDSVDLGVRDEAAAERIKDSVMSRVTPRSFAQPRRKNFVRVALIAAVIAALFSVSAYAVYHYSLHKEQPDTPPSGTWRYYDSAGNLTKEQTLSFPYAGLVFTFSGPGEAYHPPELRAFYLPSEPYFGTTDAEGWTQYLSDPGEGASIPYVISVRSVETGGTKYVLSGRPTVVKEEYWGGWYVLELSSDYSDTDGYVYENDIANYILLFDEARGYLVTVSGTSDLETLEHIARELEVRESVRPNVSSSSQDISIGCIDVGRG